MTRRKDLDEHAPLFRWLGKVPESGASGDMDPDGNDSETEPQKPKVPLEHAHLVYPDEFAPSEADVQVEDPSVLQDPGARLLLYNLHLSNQLNDVMREAADLGCPTVQLLFPAAWTRVDEASYAKALNAAKFLSRPLGEGTPDWLVLKCYVHAVTASHYANDGAASILVANEMMMVGAALRELDLTRRNKVHATRGRQIIAAVSKGGQSRRDLKQAENEAILAEMKSHRDKGMSVTDAARRTAKAGHGTSPEANRKLWNRHNGKAPPQ